MSQNNLRFELANVLFNLAVLYCQLAATCNRSTSDGLKTSSNYFCLSAGVISHLRRTVTTNMRGTVPDDMDAITLECLENLLLAQAQECFWQKAVKDGLKDLSIAKLAVKVSDLYSLAADYSIKSNAVSSEWIHHMTAKRHHLAAASQYRAALDCLEKRRYGEEVSRLQDSLASAGEGLTEARYVHKSILADLTIIKTRVADDLRRAEKDNDMIYLQPVPSKSELKPLERATMVSSKPPTQITDPLAHLTTDSSPSSLGPPLFSKLIPYSVHVAASVYISRRNALISQYTTTLSALLSSLTSHLSALSLPSTLEATEKPLGLPRTFLSHAQELRQADAPRRLATATNDIDKLKASLLATHARTLSILTAEAAEDDAHRARHGTDRWPRAPTATEPAAIKLHARVAELAGYFSTAAASDAAVRTALAPHADALVLLAHGTDAALEARVPAAARPAALGSAVTRTAAALRACLADAARADVRRRRLAETLRANAQADDISPELLAEAGRLERAQGSSAATAAVPTAAAFEPLFDAHLAAHFTSTAIDAEAAAQTDLLARIDAANAAFTTARRADAASADGADRQREAALRQLGDAHAAYREAVQNLDAGRRFYNELAPLVGALERDAGKWVQGRREEAQEREAELALGVTGLVRPLARLVMQGPGEGDTTATTTAAAATPAPRRAEMLAPVPVKTGTWTPDAGIRFASAGQGAGGQPALLHQTQNQGAKGRDGRWDAAKGLKFG